MLFQNFQDFFSFSLTWDLMGAKTSKRYCFFKSRLNPFKLFLNFLLGSPHTSTLLDFCNFEFSSSAWLCQQSSCNRNSSVVGRPSARRPSVCGIYYLSTYCKFWFLFPLGHMPRRFLNFWKKKTRSFWGNSVHFRFSTTLYMYLENFFS